MNYTQKIGDIDKDVEALKNSLKAEGATKVDENAIIKLLVNRNNVMRQQLRNYYNQKYNRDLVQDLKADLDGKFETTIVALFDDFIYYAKSLHKAMLGVGKDLKSEAKMMGKTGKIFIISFKETIEKYTDDLIKGWIKRLDTDERLFMDILTKTSTPELVLIKNLLLFMLIIHLRNISLEKLMKILIVEEKRRITYENFDN